jgi:shikimate dehydrogenase
MSAPVKACVIGHPIAHSRSPLIHGFWLRKHGLQGSYECVDLAPVDLPEFLERLPFAFRGCNVTVPHKEAVFRRVEADETAQAVEAVNTVWIENGRLRGTNTDIYGFLANLDAGAPGWDSLPPRAVVLGAGGAARGIAYGLLQRGAESVAVVNRTAARALAIAHALGDSVSAHEWDELDVLLHECSLLVNATSLGMAGQPPLVVDLAPLRPDTVVTDIVYVPLETPLLAAARQQGNRTVDGLGMLLHQAVPGFETWFGVRPEVTEELRRLVVADIEAHS